jgi:hypothetical protein
VSDWLFGFDRFCNGDRDRVMPDSFLHLSFLREVALYIVIYLTVSGFLLLPYSAWSNGILGSLSNRYSRSFVQ